MCKFQIFPCSINEGADRVRGRGENRGREGGGEKRGREEGEGRGKGREGKGGKFCRSRREEGDEGAGRGEVRGREGERHTPLSTPSLMEKFPKSVI